MNVTNLGRQVADELASELGSDLPEKVEDLLVKLNERKPGRVYSGMGDIAAAASLAAALVTVVRAGIDLVKALRPKGAPLNKSLQKELEVKLVAVAGNEHFPGVPPDHLARIVAATIAALVAELQKTEK